MSRHDLSVVLAVVFCLMLVAACVSAPQAAPPTQPTLPPTSTPVPTPLPTATAEPAGAPPAILVALQDAINQQNLEALMSLFVAESPSFVETGFANIAGTTQLRSYWDMQFGLGGVFKGLQDCALRGEIWRCTLVARDDCYVVYGLTESEIDFSARIVDDKIVSVTITPKAEVANLAKEKLAKLYAWVQANRRDEWKTLNSSVMSRAVGEAYSRVCKEYAATQK